MESGFIMHSYGRTLGAKASLRLERKRCEEKYLKGGIARLVIIAAYAVPGASSYLMVEPVFLYRGMNR